MRRLAVLSLHTSPLAQPGTGDGGGMNVYVRELSSALARAGVDCDVFTRAWTDDLPATVDIEPGLRVHHVAAGPPTPMPKEALPGVVEEFADGVLKRMDTADGFGTDERPPLRRGARQLLAERHGRPHDQAPAEPASGLHLPHPRPGQGRVQPRGGARPTPPTSGPKPRPPSSGAPTRCWPRARSRPPRSPTCTTPIPPRIRIVAPGVDHAFFGPGDRRQARRALALAEQRPAAPLRRAGSSPSRAWRWPCAPSPRRSGTTPTPGWSSSAVRAVPTGEAEVAAGGRPGRRARPRRTA